MWRRAPSEARFGDNHRLAALALRQRIEPIGGVLITALRLSRSASVAKLGIKRHADGIETGQNGTGFGFLDVVRGIESAGPRTPDAPRR